MKKRNIIISTVLSAVLCVGNCVSFPALADEYINDCFAEIKGETEDEYNHRVGQYVAEVKEKLTDFIKESGLPFEVINDYCLDNGLRIYVLDKGDSVDMEARSKIVDFCGEYNIDDYKITFFETKKIPDNGKITDLVVIKDMLSEFLEKSCPEYHGGINIDYPYWIVTLLDDTYWGGFDVAPIVEKFCNENNIDHSLIAYECIESGFIPDEETTDEYAVPEGVEASKYGDVTSSESVDVADIVKLNLFLLNSEEYPLTDVQKANADCCKDGVIDANDCTAIMNYVSMIVDESELSK